LTMGSGLEHGAVVPGVMRATMVAEEEEDMLQRRCWWRYDCYLKGTMPSNDGFAYRVMEEGSVYHRYRVYYEASARGGCWRVYGVFLLAAPVGFEDARALVRQSWNWRRCCIEGTGVHLAFEALEKDSLCNVTCDAAAMTALLEREGVQGEVHGWVFVDDDDDDISEWTDSL
jgi:hypothetical protein